MEIKKYERAFNLMELIKEAKFEIKRSNKVIDNYKKHGGDNIQIGNPNLGSIEGVLLERAIVFMEEEVCLKEDNLKVLEKEFKRL